MDKRHIVVIGAGIIGLSVASELADTGKYTLTVIADHMPSDYNVSELSKDGYLYDYTSLWAGAHYRPFPFTSEHGRFEQELTRITYKKFKEISANHPESSIKFMKGIDFIEAPSKAYLGQLNGYSGEYLENFEIIPHPTRKNIKFGAQYDTWSLNSPMLLKFLHQKLLKQNVKFVKLHIRSLSQTMEQYESNENFVGIIDCSGRGIQMTPIGSSNTDPNCYPIRGQTLMLKSSKLKNTSYYNKTITYQTVNPKNSSETDWTFIIPRPPLSDGVFILGGTKQERQESPITPRSEDREVLLGRAKKFFPEIFDSDVPQYEILKNVVGFRPARVGGFKLEKQWYPRAGGKFIICSYGAGGMGYELSFGAASKVLKLVESQENFAKL
ncbi:hypothetical protein DASC09_013060 [Saccharomycopsis crataegensis]|uniref:FAD dependent oxidoreductase domain-containing protein n=1 Tax=Saccharomycopsis crataegensis TaxID=43959 RepID=A0AAV5QGZ5_9ASCO|nr:hypothetical protein DASC09_013060 [Saccharomycopsis crataegensis]